MEAAEKSTLPLRLLAFARTATAAAAALCKSVDVMLPRVHVAAVRARAAAERMRAELDHFARSHKSATLTRCARVDEKVLTEHFEEAGANARLLDATSALCASRARNLTLSSASLVSVCALPRILQGMDTLVASFNMRTGDPCVLLGVWCDLPQLSLSVADSLTVWFDQVDAVASTVRGNGMHGLLSDASNRISVVARTVTGAVAEYVTLEDAHVSVASSPGGPPCTVATNVFLASPGCIELEFIVADAAPGTQVDVSVAVCDVSLWHGRVRLVDVLGKHVRTLTLAAGGKHGIAVTKDELYMAVSHGERNELCIYRIEAIGEVSLSLLHTLARRHWHGHCGPLEFNFPYRLCLTPRGNLLVCDSGNNRVQELTAPSEVPPAFVRTFPAPGACSVALHGDTLAVGADFGCITLLDYTTARVIRTIGTRGAGPGEIGHSCEGLCFTTDGGGLLAAEYRNNRLSMFCARDGSWQQHIGAGVVSHGNNDVVLTAAGEIIVADFGNNRVCVFSADGSTLLRSWGTPGSGDGQFAFPTALALVGTKLYVLDGDGSRVQVFE